MNSLLCGLPVQPKRAFVENLPSLLSIRSGITGGLRWLAILPPKKLCAVLGLAFVYRWMMDSDRELLIRFCETGCDRAFATLVDRYIDLAYSVAYRQMGGDGQSARDVCQEVFVALAKKAKGLGEGVVLSGWIYRSVRFETLRIRKAECRRRARESEAQMREFQTNADESQSVKWDEIRPLLDEAIGDLPEKDRAAICLRFFDNRSFLEIGEQLELSENASRMRVNRALDNLSSKLSKRGFRSISGVLGTIIGGQISMGAPVGLSATIAQSTLGASVGLSGGTLLGGVAGIMNTTKGAIVAASLASAIAVVTTVWQATRLDAAQREYDEIVSAGGSLEFRQSELAILQARLSELDDEFAGLSGRERERSTGGFAAHGFEVEEFEAALESWVEKVDRLAQYLSLNQRYRIPELDRIDEGLWLEVVQDRTLETEADFRDALSFLRYRAKFKTSSKVMEAMNSYLKDSDRQLPENVFELLAYADEEIDEGILSRFQIDLSHGRDLKLIDKGTIVFRELRVDPVWDYLATFRKGQGHTGTGGTPMGHAEYKFRQDHDRDPETKEDLAPYVTEEKALAVFDEWWRAKTTTIDFDTFENAGN